MDFSNFDYMSSDEATNPTLYNWNKVFVRYCDGNEKEDKEEEQ